MGNLRVGNRQQTTDNRPQPEDRLKSQIQTPKYQTKPGTWNLKPVNTRKARLFPLFGVAVKSKVLYKDSSFSGEITIFVDRKDKGSMAPQGGGQISETD